jgi:hypothetical protein
MNKDKEFELKEINEEINKKKKEIKSISDEMSKTKNRDDFNRNELTEIYYDGLEKKKNRLETELKKLEIKKIKIEDSFDIDEYIKKKKEEIKSLSDEMSKTDFRNELEDKKYHMLKFYKNLKETELKELEIKKIKLDDASKFLEFAKLNNKRLNKNINIDPDLFEEIFNYYEIGGNKKTKKKKNRKNKTKKNKNRKNKTKKNRKKNKTKRKKINK